MRTQPSAHVPLDKLGRTLPERAIARAGHVAEDTVIQEWGGGVPFTLASTLSSTRSFALSFALSLTLSFALSLTLSSTLISFTLIFGAGKPEIRERLGICPRGHEWLTTAAERATECPHLASTLNVAREE